MRRRLGCAVRLVTALGVGAATTLVAATPAMATSAAVSATSTVTSGPHTASTTQAGTGDRIQTVVTLQPGSLVNPVQTTTVALGGAQTLATASAAAPDGTTISYSVDGTTFTSSSTGAKYVRYSGPVAAGASGVATPLQGPLNSFTTSGGGDGYSPILSTDRVFNIWHHSEGSVDCHVIASGAACAGYPFASAVAGTTPSTGQTVTGSIDPAYPNHLWYAAERNDAGHTTDIGFNCVNVTVGVTPVSCGWVGVGTTATATGGGAGYLTGGGLVGGKLYAIDISGRVYCADPAAGSGVGAACGGYPVSLGLPVARNMYTYALSVIGDSSRMIARTNTPTAGPGGTYASTIACMDTTTAAACTGWGAGAGGLRVVDNTPNAGVSKFAVEGDMLPAQSAGASWDSFCGSTNSSGSYPTVSVTLSLHCYMLADGSTMTTPPGFDNVLPDATSGWAFGVGPYGLPATFGHRVYLSMFNSAWTNDALVCYDYSTQSVCANYPYINTVLEAATNLAEGEGLSTYGLAVDAAGACLWGYGDGKTFTLGTTANPALGCASSTTSVTTLPVIPAHSYCGTDLSGPAWGAVSLQNLSVSDYATAAITIKDSVGAIVSGFNAVTLSAGQSLDIHTIAKSGVTASLSVSVAFTGVNGAHFQTNQAAIQTTWTGAVNPTFCLDTLPSELSCTSGTSLGVSISTVFTDLPGPAGTPITTGTSLSDVDAPATGCPIPPAPSPGAGPSSPVTLTQIGGDNRDATAAMVADSLYPVAGSASVVVLARDDVYADGLTGSPLADAFGGPLLLTPTATLSIDTQAAIVHVLAPGGLVLVLGGVSAIEPGVVTTLQGLGFGVQRIGGVDRFITATLIADQIATKHPVTEVYLATGLNFADALPAADAAGLEDGVVLLTADGAMPASTWAWLTAHGAPVVAIGGQAAAADPGATAIVGTDRYATAADVATSVAPTTPGIVLVTGADFPDGLAGAVYATHNGWSVLLVDPTATTLDSSQSAYLHGVSPMVTGVTVVGGPSTMPAAATTLITAGLH